MNISIKGAREHNLKNIDLEIPFNKIVTFIGVSGSGKSTIAFDILHEEAQREYIESIGSYASKFLRRPDKPIVDKISGLSPTILIDQKSLHGNIRSTIGTYTDIYTYIRLLFSRCGSEKFDAGNFSFNNPEGMCRKCIGRGIDYVIDPKLLFDFDKTLNEGACKHRNFKPGSRYWNIIKATKKVDMDKKINAMSADELNYLLYSPKEVLTSGEGYVQSFSFKGIIRQLEDRCKDERNLNKDLNNKYRIEVTCNECHGSRLNKNVLKSLLNGKNINYYINLSLIDLNNEIKKIDHKLAVEIIPFIIEGTNVLIQLGLGYLTLNRSVTTLSGGEAQRLKIAGKLGSKGNFFILDEPSRGLHFHDIEKIINLINKIVDAGNSVLVIEHNLDIIKSADWIIDMGPGGGDDGGQILYSGPITKIKECNKSVISRYL
ncbi:MAG: hypothetical protein WCJ19_00715 [bacterium]